MSVDLNIPLDIGWLDWLIALSVAGGALAACVVVNVIIERLTEPKRPN